MPSAIKALEHSFGAFGLWEWNAITTLGEWRIKNQIKNIVPSMSPAHRSILLIRMLIPAATKAAPVKDAQNKPPGSQAGTRLATNLRKIK
jgi:hypothetical protein